MMYTDLSFEIFNLCSGTCTGCNLSSVEKKSYGLNLEIVLEGIKKIKEYSELTGNKYRIIFGFADLPKIEWKLQQQIYKECLNSGIQFGLTLTLVDINFNYFDIINKIIEMNKEVIFDLTLDPIRLSNEKFKKYQNNIKDFMELNVKKHIQILLSSYILDVYTPHELFLEIKEYIGKNDLFLGLSPTIKKYNTSLLQRYDYEKCLEFVENFYKESNTLNEFIQKEIKRNIKNIGEYKDFVKETFHLDDELNVYGQVYSIYGDLIQDKRNLMNPLGNLKKNTLFEIMNSDVLKKNSIKNRMYLATSEYDCESCEYFNSCEYNGIGLAINLYKKNKRMLKYCYGPQNFTKKDNN